MKVLRNPGNSVSISYTSIPTTIIALKKSREGRDILFIDASKQFEKGKRQNTMNANHIDHIMELYTNREDVEKEAHLATYEEIQQNDYNLNIPRYVDTSEEEEIINLEDLAKDMEQVSADIKEGNQAILSGMKDLVASDEDTKRSLEHLMSVMEGLM